VTETIRYQPIHLGSPGEDISKKDLHSVVQRFKNLNLLRLQRVQSFLQPRQHAFLNILPLLFHQNHPLLPGYTSSESPIGIPDFTPDKRAIQAAKQFSKSFNYKRKALLNYPIQGIFLMGSVGSIAFSKTSDMDIWLCHQPNLAASQLDELQQKATAIEVWADSLGLEVHFFLVNSETFSKGTNIPISIESSGDTQHYLLLEEFYRTAIFIAGRIPAWWLVPPHEEYNYSAYIQHLIENRFISENEVIDFGGLESIPAEEFISATLWHIYKSINSPHKSLLKLLLMESYASEYPKPLWLCFEVKKAIYQGVINIDELDPYLLIYSKVENYLQKNNSSQRLTLARECFYLKIMGSSSNTLDANARRFREDYMHSIATQWHWPDELLSSLIKHRFWDIKKATQEHIIIRTQLKHILRMILGLAGDYVDYNYRENQDLKLLGRKLHVFLERKPGKIEIITTRSTVHTQENELSIIESKSDCAASVWLLYSGKFAEKQIVSKNIIKQQSSLLELLAWLIINGLYKKQLQINFISTSLTIPAPELQRILDQLYLFLEDHLKNHATTLDIYNKPDKVLASLIIVNLGSSHIYERDDGLMILSGRSDPLSYGKNRHSFIQSLDMLSVSSWGEVSTCQYRGIDGLFNCLTHIFNSSQAPFNSKTLNTICYIPTRANSIILRINAIFENLINFFSKQQHTHNRYFLAGEQATYVFQKRQKQLKHWTIDSKEQLFHELATPQENFGNLYFDSEVFESQLISYIYSLNKAYTVQVFCFPEKTAITVYIVDEKGALFVQTHKNSNYHQVLDNYSLFLESIATHSFYQDKTQLKFYEIKKCSVDGFISRPAKWNSSPNYMGLSIRILIENQPSKTSSTAYYIYCNDKEFSSIKFGNQLFKEISKYILSYRSSDEHYPIYISDIDVPCSVLGADDESHLQSIHYLNYKKKIERKLNN